MAYSEEIMMNPVSSILRRSPLFIARLLFFCLLVGCSSSADFGSSSHTATLDKAGDTADYSATIAEGRAAALEIMEKTGASSISLAFIDGERLVWAETFGLADKNLR